MPDYAETAANLIAPFVEADLFAGGILVAQNGAPRLRHGFGLANREWNLPHSITGKFRLGSLTKQFTATAILQLMERGHLTLDDKIARHFPDAPAAWTDVSLFHLLTHTSGIPSYTSLPHFFAQDARRDRSPRELIALTEHMPLDFPPGSAFKYNNGGYVILGHIIERLTGQSYETYVRDNILDPLGLHNTGYEHVEAIIPERVPGYRLRNGQIENAGFLAMSVPHAAGAIYSTLDDLLAWQRALVAAKPFSTASAALMFKDHGHGYGFGWGIQSQFGRRQFVHAGGINGFSVVVSFYPDNDLFIAVLANIQAAPVQKIAPRSRSAAFRRYRTYAVTRARCGAARRLCRHVSTRPPQNTADHAGGRAALCRDGRLRAAGISRDRRSDVHCETRRLGFALCGRWRRTGAKRLVSPRWVWR